MFKLTSKKYLVLHVVGERRQSIFMVIQLNDVSRGVFWAVRDYLGHSLCPDVSNESDKDRYRARQNRASGLLMSNCNYIIVDGQRYSGI